MSSKEKQIKTTELIFLGTSAGEQYPGAWRRWENCEKARRLGGRNIRKKKAV
jgi:hypothetical protein